MTDANDLISALSKLGLSGKRSLNNTVTEEAQIEEQIEQHTTTYPTRFPHHSIRFVFPALDLVPDISSVILPEPKLIDFRSQPDALKHQLNQYNSEYCYTMDPSSVRPDLHSLDANDHVMELLTILDALASYEGESTISIVSYFSNEHLQIQYRLQLETLVSGSRNIYISVFTSEEFTILLSAPERPWIELLSDIVFRSSARSYIAAEVSMMAQDIVFYSRDFERWRHRWRSGKSVRLSMRGQDVDVITMQDHDTGQVYHLIRLACGHEIRTTEHEMQALMEDSEKVSRLRCADCGELISVSFV